MPAYFDPATGDYVLRVRLSNLEDAYQIEALARCNGLSVEAYAARAVLEDLAARAIPDPEELPS